MPQRPIRRTDRARRVPRLWTVDHDKLYLNNNPIAHVLFLLFRRAPKALAVYRKLSR